jgi:hypothetical protein
MVLQKSEILLADSNYKWEEKVDYELLYEWDSDRRYETLFFQDFLF